MAQGVPDEVPTGSRASVATASIRESRRQIQVHAPFPSWSPCPYAADPAALTAQPWAATDSSIPSERAPGDASTTQSVPGNGGEHGFHSLLEAGNVTPPEMFEDVVPAVDDYLIVTGPGAASAAASNTTSCGLANVDGCYTGASTASAMKPEFSASALPCLEDSMVQGIMGCVTCYGHEAEGDDWQRELGGAPMAAILQEMIPGSVDKQNALVPYAARTLSAGSSSFTDHRSIQEFMSSNREEHDIQPELTRGGSGSVSTRRKSEDREAGNMKKSRKETSKTSPPLKLTQPQAPKVNLGEKITALQQIVSPFGKTDRASVLSETIKYIKFLHEQIQLFSEPYLTKSLYKGRIQSGAEEKGKAGTARDLRSRGLCLVPVSWTSQVCRDDTLPDCWTPAYGSCLNR